MSSGSSSFIPIGEASSSSSASPRGRAPLPRSPSRWPKASLEKKPSLSAWQLRESKLALPPSLPPSFPPSLSLAGCTAAEEAAVAGLPGLYGAGERKPGRGVSIPRERGAKGAGTSDSLDQRSLEKRPLKCLSEAREGPREKRPPSLESPEKSLLVAREETRKSLRLEKSPENDLSVSCCEFFHGHVPEAFSPDVSPTSMAGILRGCEVCWKLGGHLTGAIFNPALAFSMHLTCFSEKFWNYILVYWIAPCLGSVLVVIAWDEILPLLQREE